MTVPLPSSTCRRCRSRLDAATDTDGDAQPSEGDVSICWCCGTVSFFDARLALREPTIDEVRALLDAPTVSRALSALWTHHLARVLDDGIVEFRCGCRTTAGGGLFSLEACAENCAAAQTVLRMCEESGKPMTVIR